MSGIAKLTPTELDGMLAKLAIKTSSFVGKLQRQQTANSAAIQALQARVAKLEAPTPAPVGQSKAFKPIDANLPRPGAGLYTTSSHKRPNAPAPWESVPMTLEWYLLDLSAYAGTDTLPDSLLQAVDARLAAIEQTPVRAIFRPGAGIGQKAGVAPPKARVLAWMEQLAPVINQHPAALMTTQFGWAGGPWDEEHVGTANVDGVDADGWVLGQLARKWLSLTPKWLSIQHRRWQYVDQGDVRYGIPYGMFPSPLSPTDAFGDSDQARVGGYDDCLADGPLQGAWAGQQFNLSAARLEEVRNAVTRYVFTAAETCRTGGLNAQKAYAAFLQTVKLFNLDALHADYWADMYAAMTSDQLRVLQSTIGPRLAITSAELPKSLTPGGQASVKLGLRNDGTGKVTLPFGLELRLAGGASTRRVPLLADARSGLPLAGESRELALSFSVPTDLASGSYTVSLAMPDPHKDTPERAFPFANTEWNATLGQLDLGMTVSA